MSTGLRLLTSVHVTTEFEPDFVQQLKQAKNGTSVEIRLCGERFHNGPGWVGFMEASDGKLKFVVNLGERPKANGTPWSMDMLATRNQQIVRRREAGQSHQDIADAMGISRRAVAGVLSKYPELGKRMTKPALPPRSPSKPGPLPDPAITARNEAALARYRAGETLAKLSAEFGCKGRSLWDGMATVAERRGEKVRP